MKKILYALSVVFVLSFFALPLTTAGAVQINYNVSLGDFYEDNICYYITKNPTTNANGEVVVAGCSDSLTKLVIPTVIKHNYLKYNVVAVEHMAFYGNDKLKSISIAEGIKKSEMKRSMPALP